MGILDAPPRDLTARAIARRGNGVIAWGDSLIAGASDNANGVRGNAYPTYVELYSQGRARIVQNAGNPGYRTDQILALFDTQVRPFVGQAHRVLLLCGTNDALQSVAIADTIANITAMVNRCLAIGLEPILHTIPPSDSDNTNRNQLAINRINRFVTRLGYLRGLTVIDLYALSVDPTSSTQGWRSGYSGDGVHPLVPVQRLWGQATAARLIAQQSWSPPYLVASNFDRTNLLANGCMTTLTGGVGSLPSSWTFYNVGGPPTVTEVTEADETVLGNWMRRTTTAASGQRSMDQTISTGFSVGDLISVSGLLHAHSPSGEGTFKHTTRVRFTNHTSGASDLGSWVLAGNVSPAGIFYAEAVVPPGTTALTFQAVDEGAVGTSRRGQLSVCNLTTNGLANVA